MSNLVPMSAADLKQQVALIQQVMNAVMKEGTHYGIIPGCPKPSLWKPGAEKLCLTFRLRPIVDNDRDVRTVDLYNEGHREVTVYCHIMTADGMELATGIGSCSTMESKYRYRGGEKVSTGQPVPKEYWNLRKTDPDKALAVIGGEGYGVSKFDGKYEICELGEKMENPDIADTYNTVLKMAKKRAQIDGILSATAASDIFTQDLEDLEEDDLPKGRSGKPPVNPPQSRKVAPPKQAAPAGDDNPPPTSDSDAPGGTQQTELISDKIPNCENCGLPVAKTEAEAHKVVDWCANKGWKTLCRNCQPKK